MSLPSPYYDQDGITIYCGDFMRIAHALNQPLNYAPFDAAVVDPPYGETSLEWDKWVDKWPSELIGLTRQFWCFGSMRMFLEHCEEFGEFKLAQDVIWEKQNGSGFADDRFKRVHEMALHFYRGEWSEIHRSPPTVSGVPKRYSRNLQPPHTGDIGGQSSTEIRSERIQRSVIFARNCHGYALNETQKPEAIVAPLLNHSVPAGGIVLDPFCGSGTTLVVARSQGKRAVGIEKRESQCEIAVRRLAQGVLIPA